MRARKGQLATKSEARVVKKRSWEEGEEDDCGETNASANEEEELEEGKGFFACYLLTSLCPRYKGRTYIGFTVNPRRRIRQHNGEIRCGAWRTKRGRPWEMALCIYGFPSNVSALQFEWAWQHPRESLAVRKASSSFKSLSGITNKIKIVYTMLSLPAWENLNLTVNFFSTKYMKYTAGCPKLPNQMKTIFCIMDELPCYIKGPILDDNGEENDGEDNHNEDSLSTSLDVLVNHVEADANHVQRTARHSLGTCRKHDDFGESIDLEESPCSRESPNATEESDDDEVGVANLVGKGKAFSDNLNLWRDFGGIRKPMEITKSYCLIESPKQGEEYSGTSSGRTQLSCSEDLFDFLKQNDLESFKQESTPGSSNKKASFGSLHHLPESNVINLLSPPSCLIGFCSNKHKKTSVPMDIIDLTDSPISL